MSVTHKKEATESKIIRDVFEKGDAWFNTGDLVRNIGFGHVQFIDRTGDSFRWKGENVSTTEVEQVANDFPQVSLSSAYGVSMSGGDGRMGMIAIIPDDHVVKLDFKGLAEHFQSAPPSYAVSKFMRVQSDFEYTSTHKIKKVTLKKEGFNPGNVPDPLYVLLPQDTEYRTLSGELYTEILEGKYKF